MKVCRAKARTDFFCVLTSPLSSKQTLPDGNRQCPHTVIERS
ncbi:hypothetical protein M116_3878 [Bacteroides fragilis str. 3719 A10]|uniref:Uncharacterized protein n=1 Tax=Bacteroides fragilis str. 3976T8 TaxID=1339314 RepID=A0A016E3H1_BACFG|nr:hypothetical protein M116_3878 [Bacteroides fragilis str. 3719 A10]EXZ71676.1 hypothetical protein M123_3927 [Bacteroides fragilis str. 3976T8]EYA64860.1 hypothetical protein M139_3847 [Bacteroides fragilis str. S23L24]KXU42613.1 hypothetical protein HMPREF2530_03592 [Bacteroides fragilis]KXU42670.1 hypothetical protein HMPREF2533_03592 [Bacteroides fragilis]